MEVKMVTMSSVKPEPESTCLTLNAAHAHWSDGQTTPTVRLQTSRQNRKQNKRKWKCLNSSRKNIVFVFQPQANAYNVAVFKRCYVRKCSRACGK